MQTMPVDAITVGDRCRKDLGNLAELAKSIEEVGLLHPVVVTAEGRLVAGERRLAACKQLGWADVPVTLAVNMDDALRALMAERDENTCRKAPNPSEAYALGSRIETLLRPLAEERQRDHGGTAPGRTANTGGNLPPVSETPKTRDAVGAAVGVSGRTYEKTKAVIQAAEAEPERFAPLVEQMDKTGKVDGAFRALKAEKAKEHAIEVAQTTPLPDLLQVVTGDFREVMASLPDASVAMVFTDPPYDEESVALYADLAREAARVLVDGGTLMTYAGHYAVGDIITAMSQHLRYWWICGVHHKGPSARLIGKCVFVEWKPILWFVRDRRRDMEFVGDMFTSEHVPTKAEHAWQQGIGEATYYIEHLTQPGETVVDPFLGSGTTLIAAGKSGRKGWGCELDADRADVARGRIAEAFA